MERITLVVLLAVAPAASAATADTSAQATRDGRWLKAEIQRFEQAHAAVADPAAPATREDANEAMFLAGFVVGIISIEKFHAQMGAAFLAGAIEARSPGSCYAAFAAPARRWPLQYWSTT